MLYMIKKISIALILVLITAIGWSLFGKKQHEVISPIHGTVIQAVYATGEVEPVYWSKIATQIAGKVEKIFVQEGDAINKDETLVKLEDSVEHIIARQYIANLHYLEKEKERYKSLSEKDYSSKRKYERTLNDYQIAKAQLDAQNEVIERMLIKSPLNGMVLKRDVEPGEIITLSDIIFWVGKLKPLRISAEVDEEDIALIKIGQTALIKADAFPDAIIEGKISEITPKGDPIDKNFRVRISLPNDTSLLIGMTVEINIITKMIDNALIVPKNSIINNIAWVKEGKKFKEKAVKTGITNEQQVQILDGLTETDKILYNPTTLNKP